MGDAIRKEWRRDLEQFGNALQNDRKAFLRRIEELLARRYGRVGQVNVESSEPDSESYDGDDSSDDEKQSASFESMAALGEGVACEVNEGKKNELTVASTSASVAFAAALLTEFLPVSFATVVTTEEGFTSKPLINVELVPAPRASFTTIGFVSMEALGQGLRGSSRLQPKCYFPKSSLQTWIALLCIDGKRMVVCFKWCDNGMEVSNDLLLFEVGSWQPLSGNWKYAKGQGDGVRGTIEVTILHGEHGRVGLEEECPSFSSSIDGVDFVGVSHPLALEMRTAFVEDIDVGIVRVPEPNWKFRKRGRH
ncbi:unnamed protein product [Linum trigynum]|uniref:Uncharacterized protein n=1 Tax=Linum trigynum TaxID=586398 RepID=A0AAV2CTS3_9ROSI